eukprot:4970613-Ditylum_brightwellii.AAC.1
MGNTSNNIPDSDVRTNATIFGSLMVCRALVHTCQEQIRLQTENAVESPNTFQDYIRNQPVHVRHLLGTLQAENVDPEYWVQALNEGQVTIATDGSVTHEKGYFVVMFHTDSNTI